MFKPALLALGMISSTFAFGHHAHCVFDAPDTFMVCGAHSGRVAFNLQNFGELRIGSRQVVLCSDAPVALEKVSFQWVESEDASKHFAMKDIKIKQISETCSIIGGLDFTPPADYQHADQNAWKLDVYVPGASVPSSVFIEAKPALTK